MGAAKKRETGAETKIEPAKSRFGKEQIIVSGRYRKQRDLVEALLTDGEMYTIAAVDSMIEKYRKGQVK